MNLTSLLDPTSTARKLAIGLGAALLLVLACLACAWFGYQHGRSTATAEGDAKYSKLETQQASANRLASDTARRIVDAEILRRDEAEKELTKALATIAAKSGAITERRIKDASRAVVPAADGRCRFSSSWVRLYNAASGFGDGDPDGAASAARVAGEAGRVPEAEGGELPSNVSPEDVLITHRDNMRTCQDTTARYLELVEWAEGLPKTSTATEGQ
jgi:hypothetical protein